MAQQPSGATGLNRGNERDAPRCVCRSCVQGSPFVTDDGHATSVTSLTTRLVGRYEVDDLLNGCYEWGFNIAV